MAHIPKVPSRPKKRNCPVCGADVSNRRPQAKFCTDRCRFLFNNASSAVLRRCKACGLHAIMRPGEEICIPCAWHDYSTQFVRDNATLLSWLKEHSICFYCGELADEIEYVMPKNTGMPTFTVLSCGECNRIATGFAFGSIKEKTDFIRDKRQKKYQKLLKMPEWTDDEIKELKGGLRRHVRVMQAASNIVKSQVSWDATTILCGED